MGKQAKKQNNKHDYYTEEKGTFLINKLMDLYEEDFQKHLAVDINVDADTITNWKKGRIEPPIDKLLEIVSDRQCSLDELLDIKENKDGYIYIKRTITDILKMLFLFDYRYCNYPSKGFYLNTENAYTMDFETIELENGGFESTITFRQKNNLMYDYIHDLFLAYNHVKSYSNIVDQDRNSVEKEMIESLIDKATEYAKAKAKEDFTKYENKSN